MTALAQAQCEACRADAPKVSDEELAELIREIPDWNIEGRGDHYGAGARLPVPQLPPRPRLYHAVSRHRRESRPPSRPAHRVGQGHRHWWSHEMRGLHRNDFIMAARTDQLAASAEGRK